MNENKLELKRVIKSPIEQVWDAWTKPEQMKEWFSPEGMTRPEATADVKVGGAYRIVMEGHNMPDPKHNGKMPVGGTYVEIDKPNKLVFTWLWEGVPADTHTTTVTIMLKQIDETHTELTLIHEGFPDENMQKEHNMGWESTFNNLEQFLK